MHLAISSTQKINCVKGAGALYMRHCGEKTEFHIERILPATLYTNLKAIYTVHSTENQLINYFSSNAQGSRERNSEVKDMGRGIYTDGIRIDRQNQIEATPCQI